jgi:hypothetical protein
MCHALSLWPRTSGCFWLKAAARLGSTVGVETIIVPGQNSLGVFTADPSLPQETMVASLARSRGKIIDNHAHDHQWVPSQGYTRPALCPKEFLFAPVPYECPSVIRFAYATESREHRPAGDVTHPEATTTPSQISSQPIRQCPVRNHAPQPA